MTKPATQLVTTKDALRAARARLEGPVAVVMTMGALHEGHLSLVHRAREVARHVILTDFVNPLQFGPGEDLETYPRDLDADLALVDGLVDLVFAPSVEEMYPVLPPAVSVSAGRLGTALEGAARPGHFDGVVTVVTKLLQLTAPEVAVFGRKDAQQLAIVQALVRDLDLPVRIEAAPIVREPSGLARSSRNVRLDAAGREHALALSRAVRAAEAAAPSAPGIRVALADAVSAGSPGVRWDYALALDPVAFEEIADDHAGEVLVVMAAHVHGVRLLDAAVVEATPS
ncbi:pantoate--beta-alanine ligase [Brachybacterium sp. MASK1Z-5]|uniref:Pantothenate synthetase n=1 Tax=Brachybacterium halotolerans TaxID=2795215 RepID=A0ABS1BEA1_9MICO|nr:pantoate--beta-alanine ligase [Brachybacterium halotolerans]MBK0332975.1 pantoate--beta-alanine ligase [Brachybacterium halotolerans]